MERLNKEIKRRTDVVGIFPNEAAIERLLGAVLLENNEEWMTTRRYMPLETIAKIGQPQTIEASGTHCRHCLSLNKRRLAMASYTTPWDTTDVQSLQLLLDVNTHLCLRIMRYKLRYNFLQDWSISVCTNGDKIYRKITENLGFSGHARTCGNR